MRPNKSLIFDFHTFSISVKSNKPLIVDAHYAPFISKVKHKRNIEVIVIFNNNLQMGGAGKGKAIIYCKNTTPEERLSKIVPYFRSSILRFHTYLKVLVFHASAVSFGGHAYLFLGKSGEGKTTISQHLKAGENVIAEEDVLLHPIAGDFMASSLPIGFKLFNSEFLPIQRIFIIKKSNFNKKIHLQKYKVFKLAQTHMRSKSDWAKTILRQTILTHDAFLLNHYPFDKEALANEVLC